MFLKLYNYFVRGLVLFLLICIPYSLVTNPELIEDDFYFFIIAYVIILLFYVVWNYIYNYLRRKRG